MQAGAQALQECADLPRICVNMGGKVAQNDWGEANWRALFSQLRTSYADHALVFIGSEEDAARATRVACGWLGRAANLCGRVSPRISAAAMSGARIFVGHDSGPLHLAAAVGVTCVGLYGNKNAPAIWHPNGVGHRIIHDMRGVDRITVGQSTTRPVRC